MNFPPFFWKTPHQLDCFRAQAFVAGQWIDSPSGASHEVHNPATGELLGCVPLLGAEEVRTAILMAERAHQAWKTVPAKERGAVLKRLAALMMGHQDDLARLMTSEQGKPLAEATAEVVYAASFIEWFAEEARRVYGESIPSPQQDRRLWVLKEPIGVCAAITPWNFPLAMMTRKVGPALAAGCAIVVKPALETPFSALAFAKLTEEAGLPPGLLSVLTGDAAVIGEEFTANSLVRKLSFTGSTAVGKLLMRQCANTVKRLSLELGGHAPFIVFDDADLDAAVQGAMAAKYRNSGQTCVCANRIYVQRGIYEAFCDRFTQATRQLKVGNGLEPGVTQGPLIHQAAVAKVESHVADALAQGAQLLTGGHRHSLGGNFYEPTVLAHVTHTMKIAHEETFGPVAALLAFDTEAEVLAAANNTPYGLAAYVFTRDIGRAWRMSEQLAYGMVGINSGLISTAEAPFGGVKESGFGREGSRHGMDEYLEIKYVCLGGLGHAP
ncbi:MAG: NAD-dependent succinate-semialdehyde dehydrogenase [Burkholderiales bacterium]